ncbi:MAG TPA: hypothetical protein VHG09_03985, partial [Longimicrobiales bacterium]|nr:hypothetical protein [Longimicrobiales bacterium]
GQYQLYGVRDAALLSNNGLVVANTGSEQLLFFDSAGAFVQAVGGRGEGPGEMRGLGQIHACADTLIAREMRRLSQFTDDGDFVQTLNILRQPSDETLVAQAVSADCGRILVLGARLPSPPFTHGDIARPLYTLFWQDKGGAQRDTLIVTRGAAGVVMEIMGMMVPHPLPWRSDPAWTATGDGGIVIGDGDSPELHFLNASGLTTQIVRWDTGPREVSDADHRLHERGREAFLRKYPDHGPLLPSLDEIPGVPTHIPALWKLLSDGSGRIWVQEYPRAAGGRPVEFKALARSEPSNWLVFEEDGALVGQLQFPANTEVLHIDGDRVVVVERDDLDVESVVVYRLQRSS